MSRKLSIAATAALVLGCTAVQVTAQVTLYGVTGDGALVPESLYEINPLDASTTFVLTLGDGEAGEAIAANPAEGMIYHWSGFGAVNTDRILERIDPDSLAVTDITLSGDPYDSLLAATYDPSSGNFLGVDLASDFISISPAGAVTTLGDTRVDDIKGLAFVGSTLYALEHIDGFDRDGNLDLLTLDPADGSVLTSVDVSLPGVSLNGSSNGLAAHPLTGELYAVVQGNGGRRLVTIEPASGAAVEVGVLSDRFASIAFVGIPEPASGMISVSGLLLMSTSRRQRRLQSGRGGTV